MPMQIPIGILDGMATSTTIKVPKDLRDRIAERAKREHVNLATIIARALDEADERTFWSSVKNEHAALTDKERAEYLSNAAGRDDLADPDDDARTMEDAW